MNEQNNNLSENKSVSNAVTATASSDAKNVTAATTSATTTAASAGSAPAAKAQPAATAPAASGAPTYGATAAANAVSYAEWSRLEAEKREKRIAAITKAAGHPLMGLIIPATLIFGMLYSALIVRGGLGFGLTVITMLFYAAYSFLIVKKNKAARLPSILLGIPTALLTLSFSLNSSFHGRGFMVIALAILFAAHTTLISGCTPSDNILSARTVANTLYTWIAAPFVNFGAAFSALFKSANKSEKKSAKAIGSIGKVLIGLVIALPVALVLILLLISADAAFESVIVDFTDWVESLDLDLGDFFTDLLFGVMAVLFLVPAVLSLRAGQVKKATTSEPAAKLDSVITATIAYVVGAVYLLFVLVQVGYFFPVSLSYYFNYDFSTRLTLPDNMTWAEYARSGFFELSGVIIASFIAIACCMIFCRKNEKGQTPAYLRIALTVIAACNFIMAVSAVLRMRLYTIWCGLTAKRVGVLMIIAVIAISLVAVCIKLWANRFPLLKVISVISVAAAVCFGCMNVDRICAEVNVNRHLNEGTTIDMSYMGELSYGSTNAVRRLFNETKDEDVRAAARGLLAKQYYFSLYDGEYDNGHAATHVGGRLTLDHILADAIIATVRQNSEDGKGLKVEMVRDFTVYAEWQDDKNDFERWNEGETFIDYDEYYEIHKDRHSALFEQIKETQSGYLSSY